MIARALVLLAALLAAHCPANAGEFVIFAGAAVDLNEDKHREVLPGPIGHYGIAYQEQISNHVHIAGGYRHLSSIPATAEYELILDQLYLEIQFRF